MLKEKWTDDWRKRGQERCIRSQSPPILFFNKRTLSRLKRDVPFYFLLQGQLSGARAQRLTGRQDLEHLFCQTKRASFLSLNESALTFGAILLWWIKRIQRLLGNRRKERKTNGRTNQLTKLSVVAKFYRIPWRRIPAALTTPLVRWQAGHRWKLKLCGTPQPPVLLPWPSVSETDTALPSWETPKGLYTR